MFSNMRKQKGIATIEFAMGFVFFWLMVVLWIELSYVNYVSSLGDLAISEATQAAKKLKHTHSGNQAQYSAMYQKAFLTAIKRSDSLWSNFIEPNDFMASITFIHDYKKLAQAPDCGFDPAHPHQFFRQCGDSQNNSPIAIYHIEYKGSTIFDVFNPGAQLFSREMLVIQENERDQFNY
ncbi:TadE/TadG family type IV pilus assembly protein [Vibrio rarus]